MMGHISKEDNLRFLANVKNAKPEYIMAKTFLRTKNNYEQPYSVVSCHLANLVDAPYCAADPIALYADDLEDAFLGLWKVVNGVGGEGLIIGKC